MQLQGLPDLQRRMATPAGLLFAPAGSAGSHTLLPMGLGLGRRADGTLDFALEFVRGQRPGQPPAPYALLDFRLRPDYRLDEALAALRAEQPGAVVEPASFVRGWLRLVGPRVLELPAELTQPLPLSWNGLPSTRLAIKLSPQAGELVERMLRDGALALSAVVDLELHAVAPRLQLRVRFTQDDLLAALRAQARSDGLVPRAAMLRRLRDEPESLPIVIEGDRTMIDAEAFAEALASKIAARFGQYAPAPADAAEPHLALVAPGVSGSTPELWNLAEPSLASYPLTLTLQPFAALQELLATEAAKSLIYHTIVPAMQTGLLPVTIFANLPTRLVGTRAIGVTLRTAPAPPLRPRAQVETVDLLSAQAAQPVYLRLRPLEPLTYTATTYVVVRDATGIQQLAGEPVACSRDVLYLSGDDFPVQFVTIGATPDLLQVARIQGSVQRSDGVVERFELSSDLPELSVVLPREEEAAQITLTARELNGPGSLMLGPLPARPLEIGLHSFREYGPQHLTVRCRFGNQQQPLAYQFLPEDEPEAKAQALLLRPGQADATVSWLPCSLFAHRYRFRPLPAAGAPATPWSELHSPFEPLLLDLTETRAS